jgi:hypothetical protein
MPDDPKIYLQLPDGRCIYSSLQPPLTCMGCLKWFEWEQIGGNHRCEACQAAFRRLK